MNENDKQAEPVGLCGHESCDCRGYCQKLQVNPAEPVAVDHSDLIKRIDSAIDRVTQGRGLMSIPADPRSDVDLVLSECKALLQGKNPPFWATEFYPAQPVQPAVAVNQQELCPSCRNADIYACTCPFKTARNSQPECFEPAPAAAINEQLYQALRHLYHNAKKSGAEMGLALDVAEDALKQAEKARGRG